MEKGAEETMQAGGESVQAGFTLKQYELDWIEAEAIRTYTTKSLLVRRIINNAMRQAGALVQGEPEEFASAGSVQ